VKTTSPTPDAILQTAFGFWNSKVLLTAVTFDLFTKLGQGTLTGPELGKELGLHPRGIADFLDALVAMKFLEREGDGPDAKYSNTPATALYLDRNSARYIGGIPEMLNARLQVLARLTGSSSHRSATKRNQTRWEKYLRRVIR
jgi:DNA-binding IclR family transcriptional regulator